MIGKARLAAGILIATLPAVVAAAADPKDTKPVKSKEGSLYLQCDGNPNNMSAGESIARWIGAATLLGIFAPSVEAPDASKRKFGEAGVAACTGLLDGPKAEGNVGRRLPLFVARAIHHIEALDYPAAIQDIELARAEAERAGLIGDPYFERSLGMSFDSVHAEALARMGQYRDARAMGLRKSSAFPHSYSAQSFANEYYPLMREVTDDQIAWVDRRTRFTISDIWVKSSRLQLRGQFAEAAQSNESFLDYWDSLGEKFWQTETLASTAVTHELAGNWQRADELAEMARKNLEARRLAGTVEPNLLAITEVMDLFDILTLIRNGEMAKARARFASRSEWLSITFPQRLKVTATLREGAKPEELFGSLSLSPDQIWKRSQDEDLAERLQKDKDNKTLFGLILPYARPEVYEKLSNQVWNVAKSRIISKEPNEGSGTYYLYLQAPGVGPSIDALLLHAALQAKSRGFTGFRFKLQTHAHEAWIKFGNRGDKGVPKDYYLHADDVIAELKAVLPPPDEVKRRRAARGG